MRWNYFDKFESVQDRYLPLQGEGDNMATQICTAVCKLVYKWYNDGDVFDNTYAMEGWCNDLSSYANWLHKHCGNTAQLILEKIQYCHTDEEYEDLLVDLADYLLDAERLESYAGQPKVDSVYDCDGVFEFEEYSEDDEEEWY